MYMYVSGKSLLMRLPGCPHLIVRATLFRSCLMKMYEFSHSTPYTPDTPYTPYTHRTVITSPTTTAAIVGHQVEKGSAFSNMVSRRSMMTFLSLSLWCVFVCVCNFKTVTLRLLMHEYELWIYAVVTLLCTARDLGLNCNHNNKYT